MSFVHLHNHSDFSVLDGAIPVKKMISLAVKHGMKAVALTDHGNMAGSIAFFSEAKRSGIKPILGQEFYIAPKSRFDRSAVRACRPARRDSLIPVSLFSGMKRGRRPRLSSEGDAFRGIKVAGGQVTTSGAVRPVYPAISARAWAARITGASACCASRSSPSGPGA